MAYLLGTPLNCVLHTQNLSNTLFKCRQKNECKVMENLKKGPKRRNLKHLKTLPEPSTISSKACKRLEA